MQTPGRLSTNPVLMEEVADGLQSRSVETCSAVCTAGRRRDGGAGGASGTEEFRSAATHLQDGRSERASIRDGLRKSPRDNGGRRPARGRCGGAGSRRVLWLLVDAGADASSNQP